MSSLTINSLMISSLWSNPRKKLNQKRNLSKKKIKFRSKTQPGTLAALQDRKTRHRREVEVGLNRGGDN